MLQAAIKLVAQQGSEKLTIRALSHDVGVSRNALYRHYANKTELLCAVAADGFDHLARAYQQIGETPEMNATTKLRQVGIAYMTFALANPHLYRLMFGHRLVQSERLPLLKQAAQNAFVGFRASVAAFRQENHMESLSLEEMASSIWATTHGWCMLLIDGQIQPELHDLDTPVLTKGKEPSVSTTEQTISDIIDRQLDVYLLKKQSDYG